MRIACFVDCFPLISETFILAQIAGMLDRGHDVTIIANKRGRTDVVHPAVERYKMMDRLIVRPEVHVNHLKRLGQAIRAAVAALAAGRVMPALRTLNVFRWGRAALGLHLLIRASAHHDHGEFDVLHCQFGQLGPEVLKLRSCGVLTGTLITSFRGNDATRVAHEAPEQFRDLFAQGERFLAVSHSIKDKLIEVGCPAEKIEILRSGIDLSRFRFRTSHQMHSPVRLLTIGRLGPTKGQEYALEAVRKLIDAGYELEYRIIGDGTRLEELSECAARLELDSVVTFEGAVNSDAVVEILRDTDVLIAPSVVAPTGQTEGVPNVLKEAMASGVPVIGTMVGGVAELIENRRNGFLVPQRDAQAIADAVREIVAVQDELPKILAKARESIEQDYDIQRLNADLEDVYLRWSSPC